MGYCSAVTPDGWRWIVDAHREGRRYIVHSDELLSAFLDRARDAWKLKPLRLTRPRSSRDCFVLANRDGICQRRQRDSSLTANSTGRRR